MYSFYFFFLPVSVFKHQLIAESVILAVLKSAGITGWCVKQFFRKNIKNLPLWPFHDQWDFYVPLTTSNPFLLHAAIYLEVSVLHETSQNVFSRETGESKWYWVQCCLDDLLLWCTLSQFWVFFSEINVINAFILSVFLFTMHLYVSCLCIGEYCPGKVILCVYNIPCLPLLVFILAVCIWGLFSWISCSKLILHFVEPSLILLIAPLLFTQNMKPYFS